MNPKYFFDFGDFSKLNLLKSFQDNALKIGINMFFIKESINMDFLKKEYENERSKYLKTQFSDTYRNISEIQKKNLNDRISYYLKFIRKILPNSLIYSDFIPNSRKDRETWFKEGLAEDNGIFKGDILFFDPDTGIEKDNIGENMKAHHYILYDEINVLKELIKNRKENKSIIIYQHSLRNSEKIEDKVKKLQNIFCNENNSFPMIEKIKSSNRYFIIIPHKKHIKIISSIINNLDTRIFKVI